MLTRADEVASSTKDTGVSLKCLEPREGGFPVEEITGLLSWPWGRVAKGKPEWG